MADRPKVILHTANNSARTQSILENEDYIKSLPIDGMVINIPQSFSIMDPADKVTEALEVTTANVEKWLLPLTEFNEGMENYLVTFIDRPGDLFDDTAWDKVAENYRIMAEVAKEAGFTGLIFDNEEYGGAWDNFPEDWPGAKADELDAYQAQASLRGKEIMEAVADVFPDGDFGVMHGPYASVDGGNETPSSVTAQVGGPENQELRGPFFTGLLEGKGPDQTLIDMGELYGARDSAAYAESLEYRSETVPDLIDWEVDPGLLENWDENVTISHMVSTDSFPSGPVTPDSFQESIQSALGHSQDVVFLYSTVGTKFNDENLDWFNPGVVRPEWIDAIAQGVADFEANGAPPIAAARYIDGTSKGEKIDGTDGENDILGGGGDDVLNGRDGGDFLDGGEGTDRANYIDSDEGVVVNLGAGTGYYGHADGDVLRSIEQVSGSSFDDKLTGDAGDNRFVGRWGEDTIYGNGGDDLLIGGGQGDLLAGGSGFDTAAYVFSRKGVTVDLDKGIARGGNADGDELLGIEGLEGSDHADTLSGTGGVNVLKGGAGNDVLDGRFGADTLDGGAGNDTLTGGGNDDVFTFGLDAGSRDVITDFSVAEGDVLRISGLEGGNQQARLDRIDIGQNGADTILSFADQSIVLRDLDADQLSLGQFDLI